MRRGAKLSLTVSRQDKLPDFSIPVPVAKHHEAAAQHYEEAACHHRKAAEYYQSGHYQKASHHAQLAYAHHLLAEEHAEEAAKAQMKISQRSLLRSL